MARRDEHIMAVEDLALDDDLAVVVSLDGHGECEECERDLNCHCGEGYRVHWCRRHSALESE